MPEHCPVCGGNVVRDEGEADHRCVNANCPAKLRETIRHFASRGVLNIEGMGDSLVNQLVESGMVKDVADIYSLTEADLMKLERMGKKSADNILKEIEGSKKLPLERVIYGLGIRFVGERTAQFLAEHFGSIEALMIGERRGTAAGERDWSARVGGDPRVLRRAQERGAGEAAGKSGAEVYRREEAARNNAGGENVRSDWHARRPTRATKPSR